MGEPLIQRIIRIVKDDVTFTILFIIFMFIVVFSFLFLRPALEELKIHILSFLQVLYIIEWMISGYLILIIAIVVLVVLLIKRTGYL
jgi:hypothetical protein